jgi:hypothetical protein
MSQKVMATVPDRTHELLKAWADYEGMSMSSLIAYLLKAQCDQAENEGKIRIGNNT